MRSGAIEARALASPHAFPRVGFIVPRYKQSAVDRNRLKRRLRELARLTLLTTLPPGDFVLRALPSAYRLDFASLSAEVARIAPRLGAVL